MNIQALINKDVDAVATVYQSSAPYLMADNVPYDIMFFAAYGLDIYSLTFITPADRLRSSQTQVAAFVEGAMEGLKFSYLNPEKSVEDITDAVPETGKTTRDRTITLHSLKINTAEGLTEEVRKHGLGWHDADKVGRTLQIGNTYLALKNVPDPKSLYTNDFVGSVKLSEAEWARTTELAKDYLFT